MVGTGALAGPGSLATVAYTGWLHDSGRPDAKGTTVRLEHELPSSGLVPAR